MIQGYRDTLDWLYNLEARRGMDFRLERLRPVLAALGAPERDLLAVHVAGTNGKGSTAAMLESVYRRAGYLTGLYTSPHLISFRERIRIGGVPIGEEAVVRHVAAVRTAAEATGAWMTFFEIATIAAFLEMRERQVDVAIVETGLGGRLDATNVVDGRVAVITSVGLDHCEYLGGTLAAVAREKAGIVKPGRTLVTGPLPAEAEAEIEAAVAAVGARRLAYGRDFGDFGPLAAAQRAGRGLVGAHQLRNAAVAAAVVATLGDELPVAPEALEAGIVEARWPGRLETVRGRGVPVVLDAAHNPEAAACLAAEMAAGVVPAPRVLVFGVMADKDWPAMLAALLPHCRRVVLVPVEQRRALAPEAMLATAAALCPAEVAASAEQGLERALAACAGDGCAVVTGSIFLVAQLYRLASGIPEPFADGLAA